MISLDESFLRRVVSSCARPARDGWECFKEVLWIAFFSCLPLMIAALVSAYDADGSKTYFSFLYDTVRSGQLWLYSVSTAATASWLCLKLQQKNSQYLLLFISFSIIIIIAVIVSRDPDLEKMNNPNIINWSFIVFAGINFVYFTALYLSIQSPPTIQESLGKEKSDLEIRVRKRRKSNVDPT